MGSLGLEGWRPRRVVRGPAGSEGSDDFCAARRAASESVQWPGGPKGRRRACEASREQLPPNGSRRGGERVVLGGLVVWDVCCWI